MMYINHNKIGYIKTDDMYCFFYSTQYFYFDNTTNVLVIDMSVKYQSLYNYSTISSIQ